MENTFIIDIDGTICNAPQLEDGSYDYPNAIPVDSVIDRVNQMYNEGHTIILSTARGMRTYDGSIKKIKENILPVLEEWLANHGVLYHKLEIGKSWGPNPIYVDNRNLCIHNFVTANPEFFEKIVNVENRIPSIV
jgi:capsule biosynthesis phosphatase